MDYVAHFEREAAAFEAAARVAAAAPSAPPVPSCPGWTVTDLVLHLGYVHRLVARVIAGRLQEPPAVTDLSWLGLAAEQAGWLGQGSAPAGLPVPDGLAGWFRAGAQELAAQFRATGPAEPVWTWWPDRSAGFWRRMQAIEAAVHRWDAEHATGAAGPVARDLAADAIAQTFEVMAPMRRARTQAPPGQGERYLFASTDGAGEWAVEFGGDGLRLTEPGASGWDLRLAGPASDLMLFLWGRPVRAALALTGDPALADRYFALVPPL